jgi:hypothetical protein
MCTGAKLFLPQLQKAKLPTGYRSHYCIFGNIGGAVYFWSSTENPDASDMVYVGGLWGAVKDSNFKI